MNRIKFAIPLAMALGIVSFLSCSKVDEAIEDAQNVVEHAQCAKNQGDWDPNLKKCVKCPEGTTMDRSGTCVAPAASVIENDDSTTTILCPPKTKLVGDKCVASIIATDTNAVTGKLSCDYGKPDPKEVNGDGIGCFAIDYEEECDQEWGQVVKSCNAADRRTDIPMFCDYGPIDPKHGGGCYRILDESACDLEWGIVANKCGTQAKWPDGTICPDGKTKVLDECRYPNDIGDKNSIYCDYGPFKLNKLDEVEGGCWEIGTTEERNNCLRWGKGVNKCPVYTCPAGTIEDRWAPGDGGFSCIKDPNYKPSSSSVTKSSSSVKANSSSSVIVIASSSSVTKSSSSVATATKYCYWGESECWPINSKDEDADLITVESCEGDYGMVVSSCKNVTWDFCDWGEPVLEAGKVDKGCFAIRTAKERSDCELYGKIRTSCPSTYTCPAGTIQADYGWGQFACTLE